MSELTKYKLIRDFWIFLAGFNAFGFGWQAWRLTNAADAENWDTVIYRAVLTLLTWFAIRYSWNRSKVADVKIRAIRAVMSEEN